jgi:hypothetical protein
MVAPALRGVEKTEKNKLLTRNRRIDLSQYLKKEKLRSQ